MKCIIQDCNLLANIFKSYSWIRRNPNTPAHHMLKCSNAHMLATLSANMNCKMDWDLLPPAWLEDPILSNSCNCPKNQDYVFSSNIFYFHQQQQKKTLHCFFGLQIVHFPLGGVGGWVLVCEGE